MQKNNMKLYPYSYTRLVYILQKKEKENQNMREENNQRGTVLKGLYCNLELQNFTKHY